MSHLLIELTETLMPGETIIYEQPLNELIRICLRLEYLFNQLDYYLHQTHDLDSRAAVTAMLDILNVIERPDLKAKLVKALGHHAEILSGLENSPNVDLSKLSQALDKLDSLIDVLHTKPGRIAQALKENEFLSTIRQRISMPAGDCEFNLPQYHRWLSQTTNERLADLNLWAEEYTHLKSATLFLLKLTRESASPQNITISDGFYQKSLDANNAWQLVRIALPYQSGIFPEFSVGQHRLTIRLQTLNPHGRPQPFTSTAPCTLTLCSRQTVKAL